MVRARLGLVAQVIAGQSPNGKAYNMLGQGLPFYQGKKEFGERFIGAASTWTTHVTKEGRADDILMSVRAPVGPINFATEQICIGRGLAAIRCGAELDKNFLFYQLLHMQPEIKAKEGAVFASINKADIEAIEIWTPQLHEQHRIVAILDEAFEGIATAKANAEKSLRRAREVFELQHAAIFSSIDTTRVRLGDMAAFRNGINYTKQSKGHEVRVVGVKDFQNHLWAPLNDLDLVTLDGELDEADALAQGDILTVRSNGNPELIGRCMVIGALVEPTAHSGFTIRVRLLREDALPLYVCQFMKSPLVRKRLVDGGNGSNIKSLNQGALASIELPLPSVQEQRIVVERFDAIRRETARLEELVLRKLAALDELKKSLLHQAFTGAL